MQQQSFGKAIRLTAASGWMAGKQGESVTRATTGVLYS